MTGIVVKGRKGYNMKITRYEDLETWGHSQDTKVRHPIFEREDNVPYPREDAEDRSYERQEWERGMLVSLGYAPLTIQTLLKNGRAGEEIYKSTGKLFSEVDEV